ncbi:MAG: flagellar filament capping protein FliD [Treponema sp.]|nr:flagellar filament capping protein FliD [Treponema sp.]MBQ4236076.1 flagellar filament capping protein FliD [Treponema sp.]
MADGISIPGVSDKYKTNDLVEALMETERIPLKREEAQKEKYEAQQSAWRDVNQKMNSLKESVKSLYSFENPFSNKLTTSSDEFAITADANRGADFGSFKIDVVQPATADRFLSGNIDRNMQIEKGVYTFTVGDKTVSFNWKGGKLSDFVTALNKRGTNVIKASVIGVSSKEKALLIEALKTGEENRLIFADKALELAKRIDMITETVPESEKLSSDVSGYSTPSTLDLGDQVGIPTLTKKDVKTDGKTITIPPRNGIEIPIPESAKNYDDGKIEFSFKAEVGDDITDELNFGFSTPNMANPGYVEYRGVTVYNEENETTLETGGESSAPLVPVEDNRYVFVKNADGTESELAPENISNTDGKTKVVIPLKDYPDAVSIIIRNSNTGKTIAMTVPETYDSEKGTGFTPNHPIVSAADAIIKYEGITITRPTNDIDDVIPDVTLHLHEKTERTATITVNPDKESAKNALITFVGKYNQVIAELNILTINKPEIVNELDYLTDDEQEDAMEKLGMFQGDFTLTNGKSQLQRITSNNYNYGYDSDITMLNQIGISTNASGRSSGYNASQLRGYLEIDEKKLDSQLESNLDEIKDLFGFDTDGDMIIDNGIGYLLDKQLTAWTQTGGIISTKTDALKTRIDSSNSKITKLQSQLDDKEASLKSKYSTMESTLNSLESQQTSITNWADSLNNNKKK